jgi:hypothetical protein
LVRVLSPRASAVPNDRAVLPLMLTLAATLETMLSLSLKLYATTVPGRVGVVKVLVFQPPSRRRLAAEMEPPEDEEPLSSMTEVVCTVCQGGEGGGRGSMAACSADQQVPASASGVARWQETMIPHANPILRSYLGQGALAEGQGRAERQGGVAPDVDVGGHVGDDVVALVEVVRDDGPGQGGGGEGLGLEKAGLLVVE